MKIYLDGTLRTAGNAPFSGGFAFVPSDITLSSIHGDAEITLSAEESECSLDPDPAKPGELHFSCRFRGVDAEITSGGKTENIRECAFMHLVEALIEHTFTLSGIKAYTDEDIEFEVSVSELSVFDGYFLADLSKGLDVDKYSETFNIPLQ